MSRNKTSIQTEVSELVAEFQGEEVIERNNIKMSILPSKRKRVKKVNVTIEGSFNISSVSFVEENCRKLLQQFDHLGFSFKNIDDIDLAVLQLMYVLQNSPLFSQKTVTVDLADINPELKKLIANSGMANLLSPKTISQV